MPKVDLSKILMEWNQTRRKSTRIMHTLQTSKQTPDANTQKNIHKNIGYRHRRNRTSFTKTEK